MSDEALDPTNLDISGLRDLILVSASAGTGKTWAVTHLASRWLLETDHRPDELLMVTFSRSAAAELRGRLRRHLEEIGRVLRHEDADTEPWKSALRERADELGDRMLERHRLALSSLDGVHARTIHSFAAAARETPETDIEDGVSLRRRAAHETLTRRISAGDERLLDLLDAMEFAAEDRRARSSAADSLATRIAAALGATESLGGPSAPGVVFDLGDEADPSGSLELIVALVNEAHERLLRLRAVEHVNTYDSLIVDLRHDVLNDEAVVDRLRRQFSLVLVDEFQDTDASQWEIFERVFRHGPEPVPVIVVGDAKQAIYGFRGGDVSVFQRVEESLGSSSGARIELSDNHRSSGPLLAALNELFLDGAARDWHFSSSDDAAPIAYRAVHASSRLSSLPGYAALRPAQDLDTRELSVDVAGVIKEMLERGAGASEIAVLCARRARVREIQRALERINVRTVTPLAESVVATDAAEQVRALLFSLADPDDARRTKLIRATWFHPLGPDAAVELRRALATKGVGALARRALSGDVLRAVMADPVGERNWTDLEHVFELLAKSPGARASASALLHHLEAMMREPATSDERSVQRRVESDADAVNVMTIHGAKGLQFPVVLIPEIESRPNLTNRVLSWNGRDGRRIDARSLRANVALADTRDTHRRALDDEARRLIYVALTRAERAILVWCRSEQPQWDLLVDGAADAVRWPEYSLEDFNRSGALRALSREDREDRVRAVEPQSPVLIEMPEVDESNRRWSYTSLFSHPSPAAGAIEHLEANDPSAYDGGFRSEFPDTEPSGEFPVDPEADVDPFGGLAGAALGRAVHRVFELAVGADGVLAHDDLTTLIERAWSEERLGAPVESVVHSFERLMARPMGSLFDGESLNDLAGARRSATEMRFTMPLGGDALAATGRLERLCELVGQLDPEGPYRPFFDELRGATSLRQLGSGHLSGSLDLVASVADRFVIVDYKSNRCPDAASYAPASLVGEMSRSGYPLQALLYSIALHRHLRARLDGYEPDRHLGGALYYYVRGAARPNAPADHGLAPWSIPPALTTAASNLLAGTS